MFYRENGQFNVSYAQDLRIFKVAQDRIAIYVLVAFAFLLAPWLISDYLFSAVLIPFLILSLAALGLNVLVGYCGQISLGSGAFMAVGAYAAWNMAVRLPQTPLLLQLLAAGVCTAAVGLVFGLPSLRLRGLYLAVSTLAAQFFLDWSFLRIPALTNHSASGSVSVGSLSFFSLPVETPAQKYLFCLAVVVFFAIMAKNLVRTTTGRQWMAIRDMDVAASVIGIRPAYAKLSAFAVSSFIIGIAGALWGFIHLGAWEPSAFSIDRSFQLLFMIIIGGLGSISGAFFGAAFIVLLPIFLTNVPHFFGINISVDALAHIEHAIFGSLIVLFLIAEPHGLAKLWSIGREKLRLWPFPY